MRYTLFIHHDETITDAPPSMYAEYAAFNEALAKAGGRPGARLQGSEAATTVRVRDGKNMVVDGPYADTKEQLAGFFTIDVPTLDEAIAWAARCPSAQFGSIEIRPMWADKDA
ncbi:MAG: YciI family protein [Bauldia sp.]